MKIKTKHDYLAVIRGAGFGSYYRAETHDKAVKGVAREFSRCFPHLRPRDEVRIVVYLVPKEMGMFFDERGVFGIDVDTHEVKKFLTLNGIVHVKDLSRPLTTSRWENAATEQLEAIIDANKRKAAPIGEIV